MWLFAYELPETLIVLLPNKKVHIVTGKTKAALIETTKKEVKEKSDIDLEIQIRPKGTTGEEQFLSVLEAVKALKEGKQVRVTHM